MTEAERYEAASGHYPHSGDSGATEQTLCISDPSLWLDFPKGGTFHMDMSKRAAVAISGLMFAGAAVLAVSAATPAGAEDKVAAAEKGHTAAQKRDKGRKPREDKKKSADDGIRGGDGAPGGRGGAGGPGGSGGNGGGGGGGGGVNIYHPNQNFPRAHER
jgi:outer membrane receptor protein involved in Fe transport